MVSFNKVMLMGNLARDPELRYVPQGSAVCDFTLAVNRAYTNKQTQERVEDVSFIDVTSWGRTAEVCAEFLRKGRSVFVEGWLTQDRWETPDGKKVSRLKVTADRIQFLGARPTSLDSPSPLRDNEAS